MKLNKETFMHEFIVTAIAQGEAFDEDGKDKTLKEYKAIKNKGNRLSKKLDKLIYFLADNPSFAKEIIDELIKNDNFYVMTAIVGFLWEFNYRMEDCYKLFEKIISNGEPKHDLSIIASKTFYLAIKEGRLERTKNLPSLCSC